MGQNRKTPFVRKRRALKGRLFRRDGEGQTKDGLPSIVRCFYCDCELTYEEATLEHLQAQSHGGTWDLGNLVLACYACNQARGNSDWPAFRADLLFA